jgi:hypothetical protein
VIRVWKLPLHVKLPGYRAEEGFLSEVSIVTGAGEAVADGVDTPVLETTSCR